MSPLKLDLIDSKYSYSRFHILYLKGYKSYISIAFNNKQ